MPPVPKEVAAAPWLGICAAFCSRRMGSQSRQPILRERERADSHEKPADLNGGADSVLFKKLMLICQMRGSNIHLAEPQAYSLVWLVAFLFSCFVGRPRSSTEKRIAQPPERILFLSNQERLHSEGTCSFGRGSLSCWPANKSASPADLEDPKPCNAGGFGMHSSRKLVEVRSSSQGYFVILWVCAATGLQ